MITRDQTTKQIGFLLATRCLFPGTAWHDRLGSYRVDNQAIKRDLSLTVAEIRRENQHIPHIGSMFEKVDQEIAAIPDYIDRGYTALQIAEALRLIVGVSKPGGFSAAWYSTFKRPVKPSFQSFVDEWVYYIENYSSRYHFIVSTIARGKDAFNTNTWVKYLLKEHEYCLSGRNAHRKNSFEIEHFFPSSWADKKNLADVNHFGFAGCEVYKQSFIDQIGNKLLLDEALNRAIKDQGPVVKVPAYGMQAYGGVNVLKKNPSAASLQIGKDLSGVGSPQKYRVYVQLRSLSLAAFAANRF